jgi:hypothetical protein
MRLSIFLECSKSILVKNDPFCSAVYGSQLDLVPFRVCRDSSGTYVIIREIDRKKSRFFGSPGSH